MKPRLPIDIDFLIESILNETPDKVEIQDMDVERLRKLGVNIKDQNFGHMSVDALPFFFKDDDGMIIFGTFRGTHYEIESMLRTICGRATVFPEESFTSRYKVERNTDSLVVVDNQDGEQVGFYGMSGGYKEIIRHLKDNRDYYTKLSIRGADRNKETKEPCGRLWSKRNAISFWNRKEEINKYMPKVFSFMKALEMKPDSALYEFVDTKGFYTYSELSDDDRERLSPEEIKRLQAIQHLDAKAKAKLANPSFKDAALKKAGKGFDFAAAAAANIPAYEGQIKLKSLLKPN